MRILWPIALITFKEGIRNRAIYGISIFALLLLSANIVVCGMIMREVDKVAVDMALGVVSFTGLLVVLFVGINLLAKDLDKKTIYMILARPVSRVQYIVGKFFGLVLLILFSMFVLAVFAFISIFLVKSSYPDFFQNFSWALVLLAIVYSTLGLILLSALSFLFASFSSTSFITFILTVVTYLIGHSVSDVKALVEAPNEAGIIVSSLTVNIVKVAYYIFPNLSFFDLKTQAAHALAIPPFYILWTISYWIFYTGLAIGLAALLFRRREFP